MDLDLSFCHFFSLVSCLLFFSISPLVVRCATLIPPLIFFFKSFTTLNQVNLSVHHHKAACSCRLLLPGKNLCCMLKVRSGSALYFLSRGRDACFFNCSLLEVLPKISFQGFLFVLSLNHSDLSVKINSLVLSLNSSTTHIYQHVMGFVFNFSTLLIRIISMPHPFPPLSPSQVPSPQPLPCPPFSN